LVVGQLAGIETVLLDLDGTLYVASQVVPGDPEAVRSPGSDWNRDGLGVCLLPQKPCCGRRNQ
jgi:hypothetical protein